MVWATNGARLEAKGGAGGDESVEVMPYYCHGDQEVMFVTRAGRNRGVTTGPVSADEVTRISECCNVW